MRLTTARLVQDGLLGLAIPSTPVKIKADVKCDKVKDVTANLPNLGDCQVCALLLGRHAVPASNAYEHCGQRSARFSSQNRLTYREHLHEEQETPDYRVDSSVWQHLRVIDESLLVTERGLLPSCYSLVAYRNARLVCSVSSRCCRLQRLVAQLDALISVSAVSHLISIAQAAPKGSGWPTIWSITCLRSSERLLIASGLGAWLSW